MILDSDEVPEFDPVTGRYKFKQTDEEKEVEDRVKAGPPKMPMAAPVGAVAKQPSPAPHQYPPQQQPSLPQQQPFGAPQQPQLGGSAGGVPPMYPGMAPAAPMAQHQPQQQHAMPRTAATTSPGPFGAPMSQPPGGMPPQPAPGPFAPPGGSPPPPGGGPPGAMRAPPAAPKYVDMFNS
jgi:serine/threonine-protein kinase